MNKVQNFSRHDLNKDQKEAVLALFPDAEFGEPLKPLFRDEAHLRERLDGQVSVAVVPGPMLLGLWADRDAALSEGTTIIIFEADQAARKRGRFAARGIRVFKWQWVDPGVFMVAPRLTHSVEIVPTVENNFSDGKAFPYGTPKSDSL